VTETFFSFGRIFRVEGSV